MHSAGVMGIVLARGANNGDITGLAPNSRCVCAEFIRFSEWSFLCTQCLPDIWLWFACFPGRSRKGRGGAPAPKLRTSPRLSSAAKGVWPHSQGVASTPVQRTRRPLRPSRTDQAAKLSATTKGSLRHSYRPASPTISANSSARSNSSPGFRSEYLSWYRSQSRRARSNPFKSL